MSDVQGQIIEVAHDLLAIEVNTIVKPNMTATRMRNVAHTLLDIISDILDLSKIEAEKFLLEDSEFALDSIVSGVASMLNERVSAKGLRMELNIESLPSLVRGDATRFTQAILNLASNAVKFTERGEVSIRVGLAAPIDDEVLLRLRPAPSCGGVGEFERL